MYYYVLLIMIIIALRIHMSPQTKEALDKYNSFNIELRGPVEMKVNNYL